MQPLLSLLVVAVLVCAEPARAQDKLASPLIGEWTVDVSRLPMTADARPRRVTVRFDSGPGNSLVTRVEVVDPTGAVLHAEGTSALDGSASPVQGNLEADMAASTMPLPHVLVMQLARDGIPASTRVYAVAADGKSMTETAAYVGQDGQPLLRTNHFERVR